MRQIEITTISKSNQQYVVYLSSEHRYTFTSRKKAEKFKNKIEEILNVHLRSANLLIGNTYQLFRQLYFHLDGICDSEHLSNSLGEIETQFKLILSGRYKESNNGASFVFEKLKYILQGIQSLLRNLYSIADHKRQIAIKINIDANLRYVKADQHSLINLQNEIFSTYKLTHDYELSIVA